MDQVRGTTEMLEMILNGLPKKTLLRSARLVCKEFKATIDTSPTLQKRLFFTADLTGTPQYVIDFENSAIICVQKESRQYWKDRTDRIRGTKINKLIFDLEGAFDDPPQQRAQDEETFCRFLRLSQANGHSSESFRRMHVSRPPTKKMRIELSFALASIPAIEYDIQDDDGIKFGRILDLITSTPYQIDFKRSVAAFPKAFVLNSMEKKRISQTGKKIFQEQGYRESDTAEDLYEYDKKEQENYAKGW